MFVAGSATRRLHTHRTVSGARWCGALRACVYVQSSSSSPTTGLGYSNSSTGDDVERGRESCRLFYRCLSLPVAGIFFPARCLLLLGNMASNH